MASDKPVLTVRYSVSAENELDGIYANNVHERGLVQADRYIAFLRKKIASLAVDYEVGKALVGRPGLSYLLLKQRRGRWKDGYLAVYRIDDGNGIVRILHIFHTKQDWENKL